MLRDCVKLEPLAKMVLNDEVHRRRCFLMVFWMVVRFLLTFWGGRVQALFNKFFAYVQQPQFDIAADAFSTFKELLTSHKILCAGFLEKSYDTVGIYLFCPG